MLRYIDSDNATWFMNARHVRFQGLVYKPFVPIEIFAHFFEALKNAHAKQDEHAEWQNHCGYGPCPINVSDYVDPV